MYSEYIQTNEQKIDFRKCGYLLNGISIIIHRNYQMIYRDVLNYTTIILKNKSRNYFKKSKNFVNYSDNIISEENNISKNAKNFNKEINYNNNSSGIYSSNELSFLIYSSNKDTNKYKRDILFGNLLSMSKDKDKIRFNSLIKDSIKNSNSFKNSDIYKYLENNEKNKNDIFHNNYLTIEKNKNKNKNSESHLAQLSSIKNKIYNTTIKHDYNNLFDNEHNYSLNDYLNLYNNNDNFDNLDNNILNQDSQHHENQENTSQHKGTTINDINQNSPELAIRSPVQNENNNNNKNISVITEEKRKEYKNKLALNEELFNTHIKETICKIKEDTINNNNIKVKKDLNIKNNKYINSKLKKDEYLDFYEIMSKELDGRDESKELENIFSEFLSEIKFKYWIKNSYKNFIDSLNKCQLYDLIKLNKESSDSNFFDTLMSKMELSNNKNLTSSNSYLYNSKSELLRDGSHSINDSHSSQTIENQIDKNFNPISKFPKMVIPQSIIPEESSNFLYSNNDYILNRSLGEPLDDINNKTNLMEVQECDEEKNIIYEENIKRELDILQNNEEININHIFDDLNMNNIFNEEKQIDEDEMIKEYKSKIFYDILLIAQNNNINISQKKPFEKIIKIL
jgi:hypothetical protein